MKKNIRYTYLGINGTISSPVYLEGIYSVKKYQLIADNNMVLTDGQQKVKSIIISEAELSNWTEVPE